MELNEIEKAFSRDDKLRAEFKASFLDSANVEILKLLHSGEDVSRFAGIEKAIDFYFKDINKEYNPKRKNGTKHIKPLKNQHI